MYKEIVVNQVSSLNDIIKHLKRVASDNKTRVTMLQAFGGISANTEQRSNMSRAALSQALHAETATAAASDGNKGEERMRAATSTSSYTTLTHAFHAETATGKRGAEGPSKLKLKRTKFTNPT